MDVENLCLNACLDFRRARGHPGVLPGEEVHRHSDDRRDDAALHHRQVQRLRSPVPGTPLQGNQERNPLGSENTKVKLME